MNFNNPPLCFPEMQLPSAGEIDIMVAIESGAHTERDIFAIVCPDKKIETRTGYNRLHRAMRKGWLSRTGIGHKSSPFRWFNTSIAVILVEALKRINAQIDGSGTT